MRQFQICLFMFALACSNDRQPATAAELIAASDSTNASNFLKTKRLLHLRDSLQLEKPSDWKTRREKLDFLARQFAHETDPYFLKRIALWRAASPRFCSNADCLVEILAEPDAQPALVDECFVLLIRQKTWEGKLQEVIEMGEIFKKHRPEAAFFQKSKIADAAAESENLTCIENTLRQLDSLNAADLPADSLLFEKAKSLEAMTRCCGYFSRENCARTHLADSLFQKLVHDFPVSQVADDGVYFLNTGCFIMCGDDGSCDLSELEKWQRFLKKYPKSEFQAEALAWAAWSLCHDDSKAIRKGLKWMAEAERLRPDLFLPERKGGFSWEKTEMQRRLQILATDVSRRDW